MTDSTFPAMVAITLGVVLAIGGFAPFVAVAYRRHGRLTIRHALLWFAFLVYFLGIWAYTLLPLPDPNHIRCAGVQLTPFFAVRDLFNYPHDSVRSLLDNPVLIQNGLNVALFLPLGFFLRALFGKGVVWTTVCGATLSLFVELTQLTGVWWIFSCPYRLFDVDDIITNTAGAALGAWIALLAPRRWVEIKRSSPGAPTPVTIGRRLVAMVADAVTWLVVGSVAALLAAIVSLTSGLGKPADEGGGLAAGMAWFWAPFAVQAICVAVTGRTIGDLATELKLEPVRPAWLARRLTRFLGGIGGFQLIELAPPPWQHLQLVFVLVAVVAVVAAPRARSLPGVIARQTLVDARTPLVTDVAGEDPPEV